MSAEDKATQVVTGILIGIGKDLLAAFGPEIYPAFLEWMEQRKTPDGFTEKEYLTYAYDAIGRIKAKQIGPKWADHVGDLALAALMMKIAKRRDELDEIEQPEDPTNPHPPPLNKPYYGVLLEARPLAAEYVPAEDQVWTNNASNPIAVRYTITSVGAVMAYPGWVKTTWAWE